MLDRGVPRRILAYVQIIRPYGPSILGFSVVLGEMIALEDIPPVHQVTLGFWSSFLLAASSFTINDYLDVEIDRVNSPDRPIPAGLISESAALIYGVVLAIGGLALAMSLGRYPFVMALLTFMLSVWYSLHGKQTGLLGNMTVAFCVAQPLTYGAIISTNMLNTTIVMVFLLTFLCNAGREVTKGIADVAGDAAKDVRSVAIIHGPKTAALLASTFFLLTALAGPIISWYSSGDLGSLNNAIMLPILVAEIGFVYSSVYLVRNPNRDHALNVTRQNNIWMITIVLSFLAQHLIGKMLT